MNDLRHIKALYIKIRSENLKEVIIHNLDEYDILWSEMSAWMKQEGKYGGLPFARRDLVEKGIEHFLCRGVPVILDLKENES